MKKLKKTRFVLLISFLILGLISFFFDKEISLFVYSLHNPLCDSILEASIYFQIPGIFMGLVILILAVIFFLRKDKIKWIIKIVSSFIATSIFVFILKEITNRVRPYIALALEKTPLESLGKSFPSAHAAVVFSMLPFFEKEYPKLKYLWIVFAIAVCFIRIYFPVHYLSDILFGAVIGYIIGYVICNYNWSRHRIFRKKWDSKNKIKK